MSEGHGRMGAGEARELVDGFHHAARAPHREDHREGAERHGDVDRHVDEHTLHAFRCAGGKPDQRETHMADGGIGHQPLDVALADGRERAEQHRGDGDEGDDFLPLRGNAGKGHDGNAHEHGDAGDLRRGGEERRHRRGRAFIDVRRPHMERHGGNLEAEAGEQKHQPENQPAAGLGGRMRNAG